MKKTLISFAVVAAALTSVAVAGGYTPAPQPSQTGVYIEGMVGGAYHVNHKAWFNDDGGFSSKEWSHTSWSWTLSADIGYQFNQYSSAELGGFWMQKTDASKKYHSNYKDYWFQNWLGYLAAKLSVPVMDNFDLFAKFGLGVNHFRWGKGWNIGHTNWNKHSWNGFGPVFAVGGAYKFGANQNMAVSLQYTRFGQSWSSYYDAGNKVFLLGHRSLNAIDLLTVGLSYKFSL